MHLGATDMSEDICLWWLAVWDQIKKCCPQLLSVSYWSSVASKNLKKHQIYVGLFGVVVINSNRVQSVD